MGSGIKRLCFLGYLKMAYRLFPRLQKQKKKGNYYEMDEINH